MLNTYTVKSKKSNNVWEFKYDLNSNLKAFNVLEGVLTVKQINWLFKDGNFPITESILKDSWIPKLKQNFEIQIGELDLSFDNFWIVYANKVGRKGKAENSWKKLSKANKIKVFLNIPKYRNYLKYYPTQQMLYPESYLNGEAYLSEWKV